MAASIARQGGPVQIRIHVPSAATQYDCDTKTCQVLFVSPRTAAQIYRAICVFRISPACSLTISTLCSCWGMYFIDHRGPCALFQLSVMRRHFDSVTIKLLGLCASGSGGGGDLGKGTTAWRCINVSNVIIECYKQGYRVPYALHNIHLIIICWSPHENWAKCAVHMQFVLANLFLLALINHCSGWFCPKSCVDFYSDYAEWSKHLKSLYWIHLALWKQRLRNSYVHCIRPTRLSILKWQSVAI